MAHISDPSSRRRALRLAAPLFAGALVVGSAACSKKDEGTSSTNTSAATGGTSAGGGGTATTGAGGGSSTTVGKGNTGSTAAPVKGQIDLKKTFWISGFKVEVGEENLDSEGLLTFAIQAENLTNSDTPLYTSFQLEADGAIIATGNLKDNPNVVTKARVKDTIEFRGMGEEGGTPYEPDKTTLVIGSGSERQVRIQLDGKGTDDVDNKPIDQTAPGEIVVGQATFTLDKAQVRYDYVPYGGTTVDDGKATLVFTGKWKNTNTADEYVYADTGQLTLTDSDGEKTTVEYFGTESGLAATKTDDKLYIIFEISDDFEGDYTLEFKGNYGPDSTEVTETKEITLKASGGTTTGTTAK